MVSIDGRLREAICATVEGVPDAGRVHRYERHVADWAAYLELFRTELGSGEKVIRGWQCSETGAAGVVSLLNQFGNPFAFGVQARPYLFRLTGICGLEDKSASELAWVEVVEAVQDALDADEHVGDIAVTSGPSLRTVWEQRQFGSVLCHVVEVLHPVTVPREVAYQ